jgi:hypothetical protein
MTLLLDPDMLEATYNFLKCTPPFKRFKLPDSDDVIFTVGFKHNVLGEYRWFDHQHTITISGRCIGYTDGLIETMAHEMIHLYLEHTNQESYNNAHSMLFRKIAKQVCRYHGFDPKRFY